MPFIYDVFGASQPATPKQFKPTGRARSKTFTDLPRPSGFDQYVDIGYKSREKKDAADLKDFIDRHKCRLPGPPPKKPSGITRSQSFCTLDALKASSEFAPSAQEDLHQDLENRSDDELSESLYDGASVESLLSWSSTPATSLVPGKGEAEASNEWKLQEMPYVKQDVEAWKAAACTAGAVSEVGQASQATKSRKFRKPGSGTSIARE